MALPSYNVEKIGFVSVEVKKSAERKGKRAYIDSSRLHCTLMPVVRNPQSRIKARSIPKESEQGEDLQSRQLLEG